MATVFSGLMCHAPIVIPDVAGPESARCVATTRAMRQVAARAVASNPDRLVLVSPHSPRRAGAWGAWAGRHVGHLGAFRAPHLRVDLPDAPEVAAAIGAHPVSGEPLDHGAMVPLQFLWEAGWRGPTSILALPWGGSGGEEIGRAVAALDGRTAVIASGDMSHRLEPGAPAGYHPAAGEFDRAFVAALREGRWQDALAAPHRADAAEDVVDSTRVAMGAAGGPINAEVLAYEGPWGVGYTEAVFYDPSPPLYAVARASIAARLAGRRYTPPAAGPPSAGAFVTLTERGELRGCIGHIAPVHDLLYDEVAAVAVAAATTDPRFPPVTATELARLDIEVSVLDPPELIGGPPDLDPKVYGVIVSTNYKRGLLLPDIDGVDTVEDQVRIASRKAGIRPGEPVTMQRDRVRKVAEPCPRRTPRGGGAGTANTWSASCARGAAGSRLASAPSASCERARRTGWSSRPTAGRRASASTPSRRSR